MLPFIWYLLLRINKLNLQRGRKVIRGNAHTETHTDILGGAYALAIVLIDSHWKKIGSVCQNMSRIQPMHFVAQLWSMMEN